MKIIAVSLLCLTVALAVTLEDCECHPGLIPKDTGNGIKCFGILLRIVTPCNIPYEPSCKCTGDVTSVKKTKDGVSCIKSENRKVIKEWNCENREDWEEYKKKQENKY